MIYNNHLLKYLFIINIIIIYKVESIQYILYRYIGICMGPSSNWLLMHDAHITEYQYPPPLL
jgi:hypothetical protein